MPQPEPNALIEKYQLLLEQRPQDELLQFSLGKALYDAERWDEAKSCFETALAAKPDWMVVTILLAKIARRSGDIATARRRFEQALVLAIDQQHEGPEEEIRHALSELSS